MTNSEENDDTTDAPTRNAILNPTSLEPMLIPSHEVLRGRREVWIAHGDVVYRLRVTSSGKLYLSK